MSPATVVSDGGVIVTLSGTNFGTAGSVTIGGATCTPTGAGFAHVSITCFSPPGQGANVSVAVSVAGQVFSSAALFSYAPPAITSLAPLSGSTAGPRAGESGG